MRKGELCQNKKILQSKKKGKEYGFENRPCGQPKLW
jgi:hypothetical protein